jgi:hypothetical protein
MMANSSPPTRATMSLSRTQASSLSAAATREGVADGMAQRVVNLCEVVQIETDHCEFLATTGHDDGLFHVIPEHHSVWQFGQCVMARHERKARFGLLPRGDILVGRNPPAARHGLIGNGDKTGHS